MDKINNNNNKTKYVMIIIQKKKKNKVERVFDFTFYNYHVFTNI